MRMSPSGGDLVVEGRSNGDIARALSLSTKTVQNYVSSLLTKLGAESRPELIVRARDTV